MRLMRRCWLGALAAISIMAATSVGFARDIGPECIRWKENRFGFAKGQAELSAEAGAQLAAMAKASGRDCGFRVYASAFQEGEGADAAAIALKRRDAVVRALREAEIRDENIIPLSTWVEQVAKDPSYPRAASVYTFPEQGIRCGRQAADKIAGSLELWFDNRSAVISKPRRRDLQALVASVLPTPCNVGVAAYSATEIEGEPKDVAEKNRQIAKKRSKAVMDVLREAGLPSDRIVETGANYIGAVEENKLSTRRAVITVM